jgi:hypothetical protein
MSVLGRSATIGEGAQREPEQTVNVAEAEDSTWRLSVQRPSRSAHGYGAEVSRSFASSTAAASGMHKRQHLWCPLA